VASIDVGQLTLGPATIGRLVVRNAHFGMSAGRGELRNMRVTLTLRLSLEWRVSVDLLFDDFTRSGTWDLSDPQVTLGFSNVTLPGLSSLTVDLDEMTAQNLTASTGPIAGLRLGAMVAEQMRATNATIPTADFQLAGLGLTKMRAEGISVPAASVEEVTIGRVSGGAVPIASLTVPNVTFPGAAIGDIRSTNVDVNAVAPTHRISAGGGLLRITLVVVPEARTRIDEMVLTNINASTRIDSIEVRDVVLPFEVLNLRLADLGVNTIQIPAFEVA
jgi:hypothetical protein